MSQSLLFVIGTVVFSITVVAALLYGYFTFDRLYNLGVAADEAQVLASLLSDPALVVPSIPSLSEA